MYVSRHIYRTNHNFAVPYFLPCYPRKIPIQVVISDSWERRREMQKNSWRSFDSGGNGYLNVYEGGAPSSHRIRGRAYMYISPRYINRPEGGSEGEGRVRCGKCQGGCETGTPPPPLPPPRKRSNRQEGDLSALSQRIYSLPSFLKPKYNGQVKCKSFPRSLPRAILGAHVESRQVETPCISG